MTESEEYDVGVSDLEDARRVIKVFTDKRR